MNGIARNQEGGEAQTTQPADDNRQAETLSRQDRDAIRDAGAQDARRSRAALGLPERIEDPVTAARLAAMLRDQPAHPAQHEPTAA